MLEALLCAAGLTVLANTAKQAPISPPPAELLEFLADWHDDEAHVLLDARNRPDLPLPTLGTALRPTKDTGHEP